MFPLETKLARLASLSENSDAELGGSFFFRNLLARNSARNLKAKEMFRHFRVWDREIEDFEEAKRLAIKPYLAFDNADVAIVKLDNGKYQLCVVNYDPKTFRPIVKPKAKGSFRIVFQTDKRILALMVR